MKINVYFKEYKLGNITCQNGKLLYNSYCENEKSFKENCFSSIFYPLFDSDNTSLETLPRFLKDYVKMCDNKFLATQAKIAKSDDCFTKLYKLSTLNFDDFGFYIKADQNKGTKWKIFSKILWKIKEF